MIDISRKRLVALFTLAVGVNANAVINPDDVVGECRSQAAQVALDGEQAKQFVTKCILDIVRDADEIGLDPAINADWRVQRRLHTLRKLQRRLDHMAPASNG